jgi:hypothetical protein
MWSTSVIPCRIDKSDMVLLFKKGDPRRVVSYRPITISNTILKIYEKVLERRLRTFTNLGAKINSLQGGSKLNRGALDTVLDVIGATSGVLPTVLMSIDLSKAFDRVNHDILLSTLAKRGIKGRMWSAIASTYYNPSTRIREGGHRSREFRLEAGVKQGSVLSPLLFAIYVDTVLSQLDAKGVGCHLYHNDVGTRAHFPGAMFVDDLILASNSLASIL